jgi:hypothetical protein
MPRGMMTSARHHHDVTWGSALLTSAVGPADVIVDQVSGVCESVVPLVSLTAETYKWGPRVMVKRKQEKKREKEKEKGLRVFGPKVYRRPNKGSAQTDGRLGSRRGPARPVASQAGSRCGSGKRPAWPSGSNVKRGRLGLGKLGRKRPRRSRALPLLPSFSWLTALAHAASLVLLPLFSAPACFLLRRAVLRHSDGGGGDAHQRWRGTEQGLRRGQAGAKGGLCTRDSGIPGPRRQHEVKGGGGLARSGSASR